MLGVHMGTGACDGVMGTSTYEVHLQEMWSISASPAGWLTYLCSCVDTGAQERHPMVVIAWKDTDPACADRTLRSPPCQIRSRGQFGRVQLWEKMTIWRRLLRCLADFHFPKEQQEHLWRPQGSVKLQLIKDGEVLQLSSPR